MWNCFWVLILPQSHMTYMPKFIRGIVIPSWKTHDWLWLSGTLNIYGGERRVFQAWVRTQQESLLACLNLLACRVSSLFLNRHSRWRVVAILHLQTPAGVETLCVSPHHFSFFFLRALFTNGNDNGGRSYSTLSADLTRLHNLPFADICWKRFVFFVCVFWWGQRVKKPDKSPLNNLRGF